MRDLVAIRRNNLPPELLAEMSRQRSEWQRKERNFIERYGHARVPVCAKMGDKWLVIVGGGIYKQTQEGPYGFMNVIHDHALLFFGVPLLEAEEAKPFAERHPAIQWMHTYVEHDERLRNEGNTKLRAREIGSGAAWFRFAYDLFTIGDNARLQARLKERLLEPRYFQAARHELRVAAQCVVAGFELQFEDEQDNARLHPEFVATDKFSPLRIAVEVKSRHRRGVQGFESGLNIRPGDRVDIRQPVLEAYRKVSNLPFYVFIEANLPPADEAEYRRWIDEIDQTMFHLEAEGYANPCSANAIFITNDPSHYLGESQIGNDSDYVWIKHFTAALPRVPHPPDNMVERLLRAFEQRLSPPAELEEFV